MFVLLKQRFCGREMEGMGDMAGKAGKPSTLPALAFLFQQYLERGQAMQWVKEERLPAFLESDCYFEYRYRMPLCCPRLCLRLSPLPTSSRPYS